MRAPVDGESTRCHSGDACLNAHVAEALRDIAFGTFDGIFKICALGMPVGIDRLAAFATAQTGMPT